MKTNRASTTLLLTACILLASTLAFADSHSEKNAQKVKVGVFEIHPMMFQHEDGSADGLFINVVQEIAQREGWQLEYIYGTWAQCLQRVTDGEIDLLGCVMHLKEREAFLDFPKNEVITTWGQVYVHEDSTIHDIFGLEGKKVGVMKNGANGQNFKNLANDFNIECTYIDYDTFELAAKDVAEGKINACVIVNIHGYAYEKTFPLRQTSIIFSPTHLKFVTAKGTNQHLIKAIDSYLAAWKEDARSPYYKIFNKWFGLSSEEVLPDWLLKSIYVSAISLVAIITWVLVLRYQVRLKTKELQDSQNRYQAVVEDQTELISRYTSDLVMTFVNDAYCRYFGKTREELIDKTFLPAVPEKEHEAVRKYFNSFTTDNPVETHEHRTIMPDGTMRWNQWTNHAIFDKNGKIVEFQGVGRDINDRKLAEEENLAKEQQLQASYQQLMANEQQLKAANQQLKANQTEREKILKTLEAKNKELQSIVYVASHDLKSPIVNINGFGDLLWQSCEQALNIIQSKKMSSDEKIEKMEPLFTDDIYESLEFISAGTRKSQRLLDALLKVSRVGNIEIDIQPLDMNRMVSDIKNTVEYQLSEKTIDMTIEQLPNCRGDSDQINQVFSNLIDNAIKYRNPDRKATINVSAKTENGYCTYCIEDNGIGIEPAHQKKVFELFHRLNPDNSEDGEGIGLTIISRILSRHDGHIDVESKPGEYSKFCVTLPSA